MQRDLGGISLRRIDYDPVAWERLLERYPTSEVFHSPAWLEYLEATHGAQPIVAEVVNDGSIIGHFVGGLSRRFGLRILGSPLSGWGTPVMSILSRDDIDRRAALDAVLDFAYGELGCAHVEVGDRFVSEKQMTGSRWDYMQRCLFLIDLNASDDELLARMRSRTRTYVRRASRSGLQIEAASGGEFVEEYYEQLLDVYQAKTMVPAYGIDRIRRLVEIVEPSGQMLMLRLRDAEGVPIASIVTLGRNGRAWLLGLGFYRSHAAEHPIEPLQYEAMRRWRERGATVYDLGSGDHGKSKFGTMNQPEAHLHHSRLPGLELGRAAVQRSILARRWVAARFH